MSGRMEHSPARIIQEFFILQTLGIDPDDWSEEGDIPNGNWPIFEGRYPDRPDDIICVENTAGRDFGYTQPDSERQEMYGIQVTVRALDGGYGWRIAMNLAIALDQVTRYPIFLPGTEVGSGTGSGTGSGGVHYLIHSVARTTQPVCIGRDTPQGKRERHVINALATIRQCL